MQIKLVFALWVSSVMAISCQSPQQNEVKNSAVVDTAVADQATIGRMEQYILKNTFGEEMKVTKPLSLYHIDGNRYLGFLEVNTKLDYSGINSEIAPNPRNIGLDIIYDGKAYVYELSEKAPREITSKNIGAVIYNSPYKGATTQTGSGTGAVNASSKEGINEFNEENIEKAVAADIVTSFYQNSSNTARNCDFEGFTMVNVKDNVYKALFILNNRSLGKKMPLGFDILKEKDKVLWMPTAPTQKLLESMD